MYFFTMDAGIAEKMPQIRFALFLLRPEASTFAKKATVDKTEDRRAASPGAAYFRVILPGVAHSRTRAYPGLISCALSGHSIRLALLAKRNKCWTT